jgi:hypothetical protein
VTERAGDARNRRRPARFAHHQGEGGVANRFGLAGWPDQVVQQR